MSSWSYRGTNLDDLGIVTMVSDAFKMPERRGGNVTIPFRHGRVYVEKFFEQRTLQLGLEIHEKSREDLEAKIDRVKMLMAQTGLGALTQTLDDLTTRTLQAEYTGDLSPTPVSPLAVKMVLEFICPDPFFRGSRLVSDEQTINSDPYDYVLNNPGTAEERDPTITLTGPLLDVIITNETNGCTLTYDGAILSPRVVTIYTDQETGEYVAVNDLGANVIGNISHEGDTCLFPLASSQNEIRVESGYHVAGKIKIEFYPPYL